MQRNITLPEDLVVESTVALCGDMKKLDIFLEVELKVKTPEGIDKATMKEIVTKAEEVCPYSKVSRCRRVSREC
jgi:organic hydroperoxide reductase OsmC/OhrA